MSAALFVRHVQPILRAYAREPGPGSPRVAHTHRRPGITPGS
jgi:hypothetical protein